MPSNIFEKIEDLACTTIAGQFEVYLRTEVYRVDTDGNVTGSLGTFRDENVAKSLVANQKDSNYYRTRPVYVLTNDKIGFLIGGPVGIGDDDAVKAELIEAALSKISASDRALLKI